MCNLLLVDDEKDLLDSIEQLLMLEGHQTLALNSGPEVIEVLSNPDYVQPDLIISDVIMPGMTGIEILERVRTHPGYERVPFLFISATVTPSVEDRLARIDAVYFLRKPFAAEAFCSLVETLCS